MDGKRPWEPTDTEKLDWLSGCASVRTDGADGGWTFSFLYVDMDDRHLDGEEDYLG